MPKMAHGVMLARNTARLRLQGDGLNKMPPASSAHQPDDTDADGGGSEAGGAQNALRHRQNLGGKFPGKVRKTAIDDALEDQDKAYCRPEILHRAYCPAAGWLAGAVVAGAMGVAPGAGVPTESRKKRKNSEFGDNSIVVPVLSKAVP